MGAPDRVYIAGAAGSGKTTLGARIARDLGLEHCDVDIGGRPAEAATGRWVVEGAHIFAMEQYVAAADLIVWLDLPMRVTVPRIIIRHVRLSIKKQNRYPDLRLVSRLIRGQPRYHHGPARAPTGPTDWDALTRAATEVLLAPFMAKVVHLRTPRGVKAWTREFFACDCRSPPSKRHDEKQNAKRGGDR